ncbi:MAG: bifunctional alpha,alpha-trehalose-phosphate synthase (UDP-forming)/trehalose-phosphatase [Porphyromonadaceae bacterium CG2_30_38_12]|nr:MAG: bifunctional alpha,alpha-trehalose-phosphate synthase (UDP-forming)/trehalose-phosphatase [Porphyromonadaceae bacterium CG2_30_38_12]
MKLIIIANRLPLKATRTENNGFEFTRSEGGLTTGMDSLDNSIEKHWIGWPGTFTETIDEEHEIATHLSKFNFHPVFLSQEQIQNFYEGYCNSTLWPLCHYFYAFVEYENAHYDTYREVNELFCKAALALIEPDDIVWIQDYQLMLLPQMIRKSIKDISIGYFHHIPFPSYELFRVLPERAELLNGLLGADLIGFHTHEYMRHFVSAAERVLNIRFSLDQIALENRIAHVDAFSMGINYSLYNDAILLPEVQEIANELKKNYGNHKLMLSVDRLDYSKGILHRIKGFRRFLENNPDYKEKISLAMIVVPSRDTVDRYADLKTKIDEAIGAINGLYSTINWTPVYYFYHSFDFNELVAMYHIADIALITPLRDGMNLVAKEYIAAKRDKAGVLILSELAGASIELTDAIIINPNDINQIEQSILQALQMPEKEQMRRLTTMQKIISKQTVNKWAENFINRLRNIKQENDNLISERIDEKIFLEIREVYNHSAKRLFILDYDGTLVGFKNKPEDAKPSAELLELLLNMSKHSHNKVVISSGRDKQTLENWLGHLPIDMATEHGASYKQNGKWYQNATDIKPWDDEILSILNSFVEKTPRSMLEKKDTTLVWHYRNVDVWLASLREQQLFETLIGPCSAQNLQIMRGNKILEIKSPKYNKGSEALRLLQQENYDFILAIGDDTTDEDTFRELPANAFTIKVGNFSQLARYNIRSQKGVLGFLTGLIK